MDTRTLLDLPSDTLNNEVAKPANLDTGSVINLSLANKNTYQLFKPTLLQRLKKYIERSAKKQVEGLLKIHLDFDPSHLLDLCQRVLRQGDIDLLKVITKGEAVLLQQIDLPKKLVDETNTYDFSAVVAAIELDQNVEEVLAKMRTDLDKIVKEKRFPFQAMLNAYEIYDKKYNPWTVEQCKVFSIKVIGYLQRLSPAWLKKALATGIYNITEAGKPCGDTFILQSGESIDATKGCTKGLGFDFCVDRYGRGIGGSVGWGGWRGTAWDREPFLKNYLEQKQQSLVNLCSEDTQNRKRIECV
ncbi:MAG: hypothetical protein KIT56_11395 [Gammaproteobacteria bacterium]|nr:hypothetical protein [Gammaproteobacteria bacterium]MCW5584450.1 hypothetical protein [Gammaproteobacteria bacterium]